MVNRFGRVIVLGFAALAASAGPALAQQTLNLSLGYFVVNDDLSRVQTDILLIEHADLGVACPFKVLGTVMQQGIGDAGEVGGDVFSTCRFPSSTQFTSRSRLEPLSCRWVT